MHYNHMQLFKKMKVADVGVEISFHCISLSFIDNSPFDSILNLDLSYSRRNNIFGLKRINILLTLKLKLTGIKINVWNPTACSVHSKNSINRNSHEFPRSLQKDKTIIILNLITDDIIKS